MSSDNRRHFGSGHSARVIGVWVVPGQQPEAQGAAVTLGVGAGLVVRGLSQAAEQGGFRAEFMVQQER